MIVAPSGALMPRGGGRRGRMVKRCSNSSWGSEQQGSGGRGLGVAWRPHRGAYRGEDLGNRVWVGHERDALLGRPTTRALGHFVVKYPAHQASPPHAGTPTAVVGAFSWALSPIEDMIAPLGYRGYHDMRCHRGCRATNGV